MMKTIVLIHGYGFDYRSWYPVEVAFEGSRTIFLSLPGFGDSVVALTIHYRIASENIFGRY